MRFPSLLAMLIAGALAITPPPAAGQRAPQRDAMVHMDLGSDPPTFIPDEVNVVPGGLVQLMLFGKGAPHSLTLDEPGYDAEVPAATQDGYYERVAEFHAPTLPGTYAFHDKHSDARGTLIVRDAAAVGVAENGYELRFSPARLEVAPGTAVTWTANGSFAHTLTSDEGAWDDSKLALEPGAQAVLVAPTAPGEYAFRCRYHADSGMVGILVVRAAAMGSSTASNDEGPVVSDNAAPTVGAAPTRQVPGAPLASLLLVVCLTALARWRAENDD